tara:strand:- start:5259 stop:5690 length:432 start_codon:yes stop_codon:yes gene_type:complete
MVKSSSGKKGYRSFTTISVLKQNTCHTKFSKGRFVSKNPLGAAKKAFAGFCKRKSIKGVCSLTVTIQETTHQGKGKTFTYKLNRRKLKEPRVFFKGQPNEYNILYEVVGKAVKKPPSKCNKSKKANKATTRKSSTRRSSKRRS